MFARQRNNYYRYGNVWGYTKHIGTVSGGNRESSAASSQRFSNQAILEKIPAPPPPPPTVAPTSKPTRAR
jgi:hypothetical protein